MQFAKKNITYVGVSLFMLISILWLVSNQSMFGLGAVEAGGTHNVHGFAWSSNIGWISMNSLNCDSDEDGLADLGAPTGCPTPGTLVPNYGVNINLSTGDFSGSAWSSNIGWIDFGPTSGYPVSGPAHEARLESDGTVTGWAKVVSGGVAQSGNWDGWIKLADDSPRYGVALSGVNLCGYAWGSDVVGWVEFCGSGWGVTLDEPAVVTLTVDGNTSSVATIIGDEVDLEWTTENIKPDSCEAASPWSFWGGSKPDNSPEPITVGPVEDVPPNTFRLTCSDLSGNPVSSEVVLSLELPNLSISSDALIVRGGDSTRISWDTGNVDPVGCEVRGPGAPSGVIDAVGSFEPTITHTTTYILDCGFVSESVTVRVAPSFEEN